MLGPKLFIKTKQIGVYLMPDKKEYSSIFADLGSSAKVSLYSDGPYGVSIEDEEDRFNSVKDNGRNIVWAIIPEKHDKPIGLTSLQNLSYTGSCSSVISIYDQNWWGKGIASQVNIARTWYAAEHLNRSIIHASVHEKNIASIKAIEKVGYFNTGKVLRDMYKNGEYGDMLNFAWLNPKRINELYPSGLPKEFDEHIKKAKAVIELGYKEVKLL